MVAPALPKEEYPCNPEDCERQAVRGSSESPGDYARFEAYSALDPRAAENSLNPTVS
jgi:hypothetical protein